MDQAAAWIYQGVWAGVVALFRVPPEPPTLPAAGEAVRALRPAAGYLRYLKFFFWLALVPGDILPLIGWVAVAAVSPVLALVLAVPFLFALVAPDVVAYVGIHLRYDTTWYVLTDRSLRIRRGILSIHETTISFENVQNVEVRQGPVQRYFEIADVIVTTAGGGARQVGPQVQQLVAEQPLRQRVVEIGVAITGAAQQAAGQIAATARLNRVAPDVESASATLDVGPPTRAAPSDAR